MVERAWLKWLSKEAYALRVGVIVALHQFQEPP